MQNLNIEYGIDITIRNIYYYYLQYILSFKTKVYVAEREIRVRVLPQNCSLKVMEVCQKSEC